MIILKHLVALALLISTTSLLHAQSAAIDDFYASDEPKYQLFAYQSMLRLLNSDDKNQEFNYLIRDLDHLKLAMHKQAGEADEKTYGDLVDALNGGNHEELFRFNRDGNRCRFFEINSRKSKTSWVAVVNFEGRTGVMEMVGTLDLKYLDALSELNFDLLEQMTRAQNPDWD